ncbi:MAG TPA: pyridoxamine 5'-phosphate oxidase family protein [Ignavibacteriaceae bacterium]|nr:pyridoxamine 5'-phosphate oxidase family protein [Ignavibacteriaceae bacterium]
MHRKISYIRDLEIIERELNDSSGGILAFNVDGEKVMQFTTTYLYLDKNIYFFLDKDDEVYEKINFNGSASFTVVKDERVKKIRAKEASYYLFSASVAGPVKIVEEKKIIDEIKHKYLSKYSLRRHSESKSSHLKELVMIDSEEIQATEEEGV